MRIRVIVHRAEEGGYWAEVPSIPGCATQGETMEEIEANIREAIEGCLSWWKGMAGDSSASMAAIPIDGKRE